MGAHSSPQAALLLYPTLRPEPYSALALACLEGRQAAESEWQAERKALLETIDEYSKTGGA
jgi:hypothetical protein